VTADPHPEIHVAFAGETTGSRGVSPLYRRPDLNKSLHFPSSPFYHLACFASLPGWLRLPLRSAGLTSLLPSLGLNNPSGTMPALPPWRTPLLQLSNGPFQLAQAQRPPPVLPLHAALYGRSICLSIHLLGPARAASGVIQSTANLFQWWRGYCSCRDPWKVRQARSDLCQAQAQLGSLAMNHRCKPDPRWIQLHCLGSRDRVELAVSNSSNWTASTPEPSRSRLTLQY